MSKNQKIFEIEKFGAKPLQTPMNTEKKCRKMIVKGKYSYSYSTINLRTEVAKRFRRFSKKGAPSHSEALKKIMDFFEWNGIDPSDGSVNKILDEIQKNRKKTETAIKRTESSIAIIRNIEITQTRPSYAILALLLGEAPQVKTIPKVEPRPKSVLPLEKEQIEVMVPKRRLEMVEWKMRNLKEEFNYAMENVKKVKNPFGKDYLKIEITDGEWERFKRSAK